MPFIYGRGGGGITSELWNISSVPRLGGDITLSLSLTFVGLKGLFSETLSNAAIAGFLALTLP